MAEIQKNFIILLSLKARSKCVKPNLQQSCHICMRLEAMKEMFGKVMDNQCGFTIFLSNLDNFPGGCEKRLWYKAFDPLCYFYDPSLGIVL